MRRDLELVRNILIAIGDKNLTDSEQLREELGVTSNLVSYHLELLAYDAKLIKMEAGNLNAGFSYSIDEDKVSEWKNINLTWEGNDFLDSIGNDDIWETITAKLSSSAEVLMMEAIKNVVINGDWEGWFRIMTETASVLALKDGSSDLPKA